VRLVFIFLLFGLLPVSWAGEDRELQGDAQRGRFKFRICASCHGERALGNRRFDAPKLAGLPEWYVVRQVKNLKRGVRGSDPRDSYAAQMIPFLRMLRNEMDIRDVAAYIASLPSPRLRATVEGDAVQGKRHYEILCKSCHGADGAGNRIMHAPPVAGRTDWYLGRQLMNFREGIRGAHADDTYGALMRASAQLLPDYQALLDVVAYMAELESPGPPEDTD
jgi:cytochrome c oxidase subunit 2